ncbi:MAG TPA: thioredoxin family protein [Candidatus Dormibacteraeota bacterium]|nr:thioredoxin family protein [Candidatus Dormibacteraeota bacterium]
MVVRLAFFALLLAALPALYFGVRISAMVRRRGLVGAVKEPALSQGAPTLLFFTGEYCTTCKYRQKPAIESLRDVVGLRVVEIDAAREDRLAKRFKVLSLPTTVLLAADGRVGAVNYGFAPGDQLRAQLAGLA